MDQQNPILAHQMQKPHHRKKLELTSKNEKMNFMVSIWHMRKSICHLFFSMFSGRMGCAFEVLNSHSRSAKYARTN
jgi:hypothetical protein